MSLMSMYVHVCMSVGEAECIFLFVCRKRKIYLLRKYAKMLIAITSI